MLLGYEVQYQTPPPETDEVGNVKTEKQKRFEEVEAKWKARRGV